MEYTTQNDNNYLCHYGIKGQSWGVRRYQNEDGTLTPEGIERYLQDDKAIKGDYNKIKKNARYGFFDSDTPYVFENSRKSELEEENRKYEENIKSKIKHTPIIVNCVDKNKLHTWYEEDHSKIDLYKDEKINDDEFVEQIKKQKN